MKHRVGIVLVDAFEGDLRAMAAERHVWIVATPGNTAGVGLARLDQERHRYPYAGVTTFTPGDGPAESLLGVLATIDLHHGRHACSAPWQEMEVIGIDATALDPETVLGELEADAIRLTPTEHGLIIARDAGGQARS